MVNNFILSIYTKLLLTDQIFTSVSYTFISYMVMYEAKVMFNVLSTILEKHFNCTVPLSALLRQLRLLSGCRDGVIDGVDFLLLNWMSR